MKKLFLIFFIPLLLKTHSQNFNKQIIENQLKKVPKGCKYSVFIYDPLADDTLFVSNILEPLIPASNVKLLTTASLIGVIGEDYNLETQFFTVDNDFSDHIIDGNILIKGIGDPTITVNDLDTAISYIKSLGISRITGKIVADESVFDSVYTRDDWIVDEKANVNLPPVAGLILNRNSINLRLYKKGNSVSYDVVPNYNFIHVEVIKGVNNKRARFESNLSQTAEGIKLTVRYNPSYNFKVKYISEFVKDPALFFAQAVKSEFEKQGITIDGKSEKGLLEYSGNSIYSIVTPISEIMNDTNKDSNNYFAESLFKLLGWINSGKEGNSFYATQAVLGFLEDINIDTEDLEIVDGSGISRFNRLTTDAIVKLLTHMYFDPIHFPIYLNSLAIGATDGTLEKRFSDKVYGKHFRGKTGTLNGVSSISGYLTTFSGNDLIISILMEFKQNGANLYRKIQDDIIENLVNIK